jgi:hypothetical protein
LTAFGSSGEMDKKKQDKQYTYKHNVEARWRNHFYRAKERILRILIVCL